MTLVATGLLSAVSGSAQGQSYYYPQPLPPLPPGYVYVYSTRPTFVPQYRTVVPRTTRPPNSTGYQNRPYYGAYGYGFSSNGSTDGFPPFQGRRNR